MQDTELKLVEFRYFPSLIYQFDVPNAGALNENLLSSIRSLREADTQGVSRSNLRELGGWHSREDLHKKPEFAPIVHYVNKACGLIQEDLFYHPEYSIKIVAMWSIVNPPGAVNLSHVHPGCLWSGVYYISAPLNSGKISFTDPRAVNVMMKPVYDPQRKPPKKTWTHVNFTPTAGRMLIFPSWLYHSVGLNLAEAGENGGERTIISFNLSQSRVRKTD